MDEQLYNLCDWGEIEAIVYSEHDDPHNILGPHITEEGILINAFIPTAISVKVKLTRNGKVYEMEKVDEGGFFAVIVPSKKIPTYTYCIIFDNQTEIEISDPYAYKPIITESDMNRFANGIHYNIYDKLGAHVTEIKGVKGVQFAVWAPNAIRVSVVGDFNLWDGRRHPMKRLGTSGIFELFIPNVSEGELYKYEIKLKGGLVILKADPYAFYSELRPKTASIVYNIGEYTWKDKVWLEKRKSLDYEKEPILIYEVHLGSWIQKEERDEYDNAFYNYRELAVMLCNYVKEMGYTHIELMPIMEHPFDASWGYQVTGYYATTSRYGTPDDFMYFIDFMHQNGIGVILDWVPAHFPRDSFGLANFDGTCLYEHLDPRQGAHPHWGTLIYNYGRPQVANFLIANANFWVEKYHADGIRMDAVASMIYLDYGKKHGEWVANIYGGNENLEALAMLKSLNALIKNKKNGAFVIAEESTAWPQITDSVENNGLGFQYKWNMGWMNDFINYMKCDPLFRKGRQNDLTFSMIYAYSEKFILVLSHDEVVHEKGSMINKMPGDHELKFANLRAAYGYMIAHPGKKLLFMGQEFAQYREWSENRSLDWYLLNDEDNANMKNYVKDLNWFYQAHKALFRKDFNMDGFEWINNMDCDRSIVAFLRKSDKIEETLLIVCNFTPVVYENYLVGVPFNGKFKEIFNSDKLEYGGTGNLNSRLKQAKEQQVDGRDYSIKITVPPLGITIFNCTPTENASIRLKRKKENIKDLVQKSFKELIKDDIIEKVDKKENDSLLNYEEKNPINETLLDSTTKVVINHDRDEEKAELKEDLKEEIKEDLKEDLKDEIKEDLKEDLKDEIKDEIKEELKYEIKEELQGTNDSLKKEVEENLKEEIIDQIKNQIEDQIEENQANEDKQNVNTKGDSKEPISEVLNEEGYLIPIESGILEKKKTNKKERKTDAKEPVLDIKTKRKSNKKDINDLNNKSQDITNNTRTRNSIKNSADTNKNSNTVKDKAQKRTNKRTNKKTKVNTIENTVKNNKNRIDSSTQIDNTTSDTIIKTDTTTATDTTTTEE